MKDPIVVLIRKFAPANLERGEWDFPARNAGAPRLLWRDLHSFHRVLIVADPGAGKTFEALESARKLRERGKQAFFIRIEKISGGFETAFEVGSADDFNSWLGSTEEAWFFLDSVDEAQLETPRALEAAILTFGTRIREARERAHLYITTREDAWQALPDQKLIEQHIPHGASNDLAEKADRDGGGEPATLKVFRLAPLTRDQIKLFASYHGVSDVDPFVDAIERANLMYMAERPFDLRALIRKWQADGTLGSRLDVMRRLVELQLAPISSYGAAVRVPADRARKGLYALAAAATLTGKNMISMPDGIVGAGRLDPRVILPDWSNDELDALLRTGVFDDIVYGSVRFRHREIRELLTAEWAMGILGKPGGRTRVEGLFFRQIYDEQVVVQRLRPALTWLILFDEQIRDRAMVLGSDIATEGGDPSQLPLETRRSMLADIVQQIASDTERGPSMDNAAIARIASADLAHDTEELIRSYGSNDEAVFFLGRLVWQGQLVSSVPLLLPIACDSTRGLYARIAAIRAVMTVGSDDQKRGLFAGIAEAPDPLARRLLAEIIEDAAPTTESVNFLLRMMDNLAPYERYQATGLMQELRAFVDRLPIMADGASDQPLVRLVEGLIEFLGREPLIERRECKVSQAFAWIVPIALRAVERLVEARAGAALQPSALSVLLKAPAVRFQGYNQDWDEDDRTKLSTLVPRWPALNDRLYWNAVEERREAVHEEGRRLTDDWELTIYDNIWNFGPEDFDRCLSWITDRPEPDDRLVALSRCFLLYVQGGKAPEMLEKLRAAVQGQSELEAELERRTNPPPTPVPSWQIEHQNWEIKRVRRERKNARDRAEWVAALRGNPERVRRPSTLSPGEMSSDQYHLLLSIPGEGFARYDARAGWKALIPEFGEEVARAFRDVAVDHWRHYRPRFMSEGANTSSTPYALIMGLVGLEIESEETASFPDALSRQDAESAFRYIVWELNGFPRWFERLYRSHRESGLRIVSAELQWELENSRSGEPRHYLLADIEHYAPWLHGDIAPMLYDWLLSGEPVIDDTLNRILTILQGGGVPSGALASLARQRIGAMSEDDGQRSRWYSLWVATDPDAAIPALDDQLASLPDAEATSFAERFITALIGSRSGGETIPTDYRTAHHLKTLYLLTHRHIRVADDINRANTGVYSPNQRDRAQDGRDALFRLLSEAPGAETYWAIKALASEHPEAAYRIWMGEHARQRAVADADEPLWSDQKFQEFASTHDT